MFTTWRAMTMEHFPCRYSVGLPHLWAFSSMKTPLHSFFGLPSNRENALKRFGFVFLLLACVCMMCPLSWAQPTQGTILGTVKDSSGASIASATVKLTGVDTGVVKTAQVDS